VCPQLSSLPWIIRTNRREEALEWIQVLTHCVEFCRAQLAKQHISKAAEEGRASGASEGGEGPPDSVANEYMFKPIAVLGQGRFGKVVLVRKRDTKYVYAMKIMQRKQMSMGNLASRTITERDIMASICFPFLMPLRFSFATETKLFLVTPFAAGGDFFNYLRKNGRLGEDRCRYHTAQISLALNHLHEHGIIYRDLKPENILMDKDGNCILTDFGLSRDFRSRPMDLSAYEKKMAKKKKAQEERNRQQGTATASPKPGSSSSEAVSLFGASDEKLWRTTSICGTENYMAPEMLLQQPYSKAVDWWALGILFSEMLTGRHPFQGSTVHHTLKNIVTRQPRVDNKVSPAAKSLLQCLLRRNYKQRICCGKHGFTEMKVHPFFCEVKWEKMRKGEVEPLFKPIVKFDADTCNFETIFTSKSPFTSISPEGGPMGAGNEESSNGGFKLFGSPDNPDKNTMELFNQFYFASPDWLVEKQLEFNVRKPDMIRKRHQSVAYEKSTDALLEKDTLSPKFSEHA
jgi:serine/threonine protein kinase